MKGTKIAYLVILLIIIVAVIGWALMISKNKEKAQQNKEKFCEIDEDCDILYGVEYGNDCTAGCFNKNFEFKTCEDKIFSSFPPEMICKCIDNTCKMIEE